MQGNGLDLLRSRMSIVAYAIVSALLVLTGGFWHFQIAQSGQYAELADKNRFKQIPLLAPRGRILDREGRILVDNRPSFNVLYVPQNSLHPVAETVGVLAAGLDVPPAELLDRINRKRNEPKFRPIILKEDIGVADIAYVKAHRMELQEMGISVEYQPRRRYLGDLAAHAIGYVAEVNAEDLKREEFAQYRSGDEVGKSGLERTYNAVLRGKDGYRRVVVDRLQREVERLDEEPAAPGHNIRTTLDLDLQRAAEEAFGDQSGAAVAIDPQTGEVLVLTSKPSFDPSQYALKLTDPQKSLRNRVIQDHYSPGSVFKVFMTVAGLESQTLNPLEHVNCSGVESIYGLARHCWKAGGHGSIALYEALVNSCNIFFYNVGKKLDIDKIAYYSNKMGLGRISKIDLPNENAGIIPSREWKARVYKTKNKSEQVWRDSETISVAIGQGQVSVTPLQVTWAMGGLASGGRLMQPHLVKPEILTSLGFKARGIQEETYHVGAETLDIVSRAMWGVVNDGGTGTKAAVPGFDVAGKTGTAQVVALSAHNSKDENTEDNAWFVGFAPYRSPEIVVGVFVEHGGHGGSAAAPIAHAIFETYYRKKTGQFHVQDTGKIAALGVQMGGQR